MTTASYMGSCSSTGRAIRIGDISTTTASYMGSCSSTGRAIRI